MYKQFTMKTLIFIALLFISSVGKEEVEVVTMQDKIDLDGEIHKQNLINSVEDFLKEMNVDPDTVYVPFRDTM